MERRVVMEDGWRDAGEEGGMVGQKDREGAMVWSLPLPTLTWA